MAAIATGLPRACSVAYTAGPPVDDRNVRYPLERRCSEQVTEQAEETSEARPPAAMRRTGRPRLRAGAVIALAFLVGLGVWLVVRHKNSSSSSPVPQRATPVTVSPTGLKTLSRTVGQPIYWAGRKPRYRYELTKASDNRVWIRYLPPGVALGANSPYLTIGTYPLPGAFAVTSSLAQKSGSVTVHIGGQGVAFYSRTSPTNVYLAYPGSDYQVEVYSPSASEARRLVSSGQITAVGPSSSASAAHAVSVTRLKAAAASMHHPLYWVGPAAGKTYELTDTLDGRVYLRYLPRTATIGANKPYLTIGTYPVPHAYSVTRALLKNPGGVAVAVGAGGVAVYNSASPTNVYLAFRGVSFQIEVYSPSAARARQLVASNSVVLVP